MIHLSLSNFSMAYKLHQAAVLLGFSPRHYWELFRFSQLVPTAAAVAESATIFCVGEICFVGPNVNICSLY